MLKFCSHLLLSHVHPISHLLGHLSEPLQGLLDCWDPHDVEAMEDLSVDACLPEDGLWDLAVLARGALNQIDHVVDAAILETEFLLLVTSVHYGGSEIICCLSLDDEIEHIVSILRYLIELLFCLFCLFWLGLLLNAVVLVLLIRVRVVDLSELILIGLVVEYVLIIFYS